jgi:nucleoside-diphosphate-sugar epimerase
MAEHAVLAAADLGVHSIVLRPGLVYGAGGAGIVGLWIDLARRAGARRTIGYGTNPWSAVHLHDLAHAYALALTRAQREHLCISQRANRWRCVRSPPMSKALGQDATVTAWQMDEAREHLGVLVDGLAAEKRIDATRAGHLLGWDPKRPSLFDELAHGSYPPLFAVLPAKSAS